MAKQKVYVVITTDTPAGEDEYICDIILITSKKLDAEKIVNKLQKREPIKGINYNNLIPFSDVNYFERTLNVPINNGR